MSHSGKDLIGRAVFVALALLASPVLDYLVDVDNSFEHSMLIGIFLFMRHQ